MVEFETVGLPLSYDTEYPLQPLDEEIFNAAWRQQIEALEQADESDLLGAYAEQGVAPASWRLDAEQISTAMEMAGLTDKQLAYQLGDEHAVLEQVLAGMGRTDIVAEQFAWHLRRLRERVQALQHVQPFAKRLRGEHLAAFRQREHDAADH